MKKITVYWYPTFMTLKLFFHAANENDDSNDDDACWCSQDASRKKAVPE